MILPCSPSPPPSLPPSLHPFLPFFLPCSLPPSLPPSLPHPLPPPLPPSLPPSFPPLPSFLPCSLPPSLPPSQGSPPHDHAGCHASLSARRPRQLDDSSELPHYHTLTHSHPHLSHPICIDTKHYSFTLRARWSRGWEGPWTWFPATAPKW